MKCPKCDKEMDKHEIEIDRFRIVKNPYFYSCDECNLEVTQFGDINIRDDE